MSREGKMMKKKDHTIVILSVILVIVVIGMIVSISLPDRRGEFVPPAFEENVQRGIPEVSEERGYTELYQDGMAYHVAICGIPYVEKENLVVYFTNQESNDCYLKLRVLDSEDNILGETGLLKPNEYVKSVRLSDEIKAGTPIKFKIMGYEPDTYESEGAVVLKVTVGTSME